MTVTGVDDFARRRRPCLHDRHRRRRPAPTRATTASNAADVAVTNTDNDTAGITVTPTTGLTTTEAGGTATFTVVLTQPADRERDDRAGVERHRPRARSRRRSLTFTTANWNVPQTVTVTGVDDAVDDGDMAYTIVTAPATSTDPNYNGLNAADVSVTNTDNDTGGHRGHADRRASSRPRRGGTATFTVVLTQPADRRRDDRPSRRATRPRARSSPAQLTFTAANWNAPQTRDRHRRR